MQLLLKMKSFLLLYKRGKKTSIKDTIIRIKIFPVLRVIPYIATDSNDKNTPIKNVSIELNTIEDRSRMLKL